MYAERYGKGPYQNLHKQGEGNEQNNRDDPNHC